MKCLKILTAVLIASALLSGCNITGGKTSSDAAAENTDKTISKDQEGIKKPSITSTPATPSANTNHRSDLQNGSSDPSKDAVKSQDNAQENFYGTWTIKKKLAYGRVSTYSNEDVNTMIGKEMSFSREKASCFGDTLSYLKNTANNPKYDKTTLPKSKFEQENTVTFAQLGITDDSIVQINAEDSNHNGCIFFIKDDNTLILTGGGVYLELDRK